MISFELYQYQKKKPFTHTLVTDPFYCMEKTSIYSECQLRQGIVGAKSRECACVKGKIREGKESY